MNLKPEDFGTHAGSPVPRLRIARTAGAMVTRWTTGCEPIPWQVLHAGPPFWKALRPVRSAPGVPRGQLLH